MQRAQRRNNDAELDVAKSRMVFDQRESTQMQTCGQCDAIDAGIHRRAHSYTQGFLGPVHGQFFHAIDENQTIPVLGIHGRTNVAGGCVGECAKVELDHRLVGVGNIEFEFAQFVFDKFGVKAIVRYHRDHRIRDMANAAQARSDQRQLCRGNINAHAADHDRNQFFVAEFQTEIINALHHQAPVGATRCRSVRSCCARYYRPPRFRTRASGSNNFCRTICSKSRLITRLRRFLVS